MRRAFHSVVHHTFHYIVLMMILIGGIFSFISFRNYPVLQLLIGVITCLLYFLWGVVHHFVDGNLSVKIVIEYLSVTIFAIIILWNVIIV